MGYQKLRLKKGKGWLRLDLSSVGLAQVMVLSIWLYKYYENYSNKNIIAKTVNKIQN